MGVRRSTGPRRLGRASARAATLLVTLSLIAPLAIADEITGSILSSADEDGDGYFDASETAFATDPRDRTSTPLRTAIAALDAHLATSDLAASNVIIGAWASANASLESGATATTSVLTQTRLALAAEFATARAGLAEFAREAREPLSPEDAATFDATVEAVDGLLAELSSQSNGTFVAAAGLATTARAPVRSTSDTAFAFTLNRSRETFEFARMRAVIVQITTDTVLGASARFVYDSEIMSGTIGEEDESGIPLQGVYVDLDHDGVRAADGSEDVSITDNDGDLFANRIERLLNTDPNNDRSTPEDVDRDNWGSIQEVLSASTLENAARGPVDPRRTPLDSDGDGFSNAEEDRNLDGIVDAPYETDPEDPASHPRPTADFTFAPGVPSALDDVQFTDASTYPEPIAPPGATIVAWRWDFGDGTNSTERDPVHRFPDDGAFQVRLTVTENHGATSTLARVVTVVNLVPVSAFVVTSTPTIPDPLVRFTATGSSDPDGTIVSYRWDFGDGSAPFTTTASTASHFYAVPGTYPVTLTVTDDDAAQTSVTQDVVVANVIPRAAFVHADPPARLGFATRFEDASLDPLAPIVAWHWSFGDGATANTPNATHTYLAAGTFDVSLTVTDSVGATDTKTLAVLVYDPPTVDFAASSPQDDVTPIVFTDLTVAGGAPLATWHWDFGDGTTSTAQNPVHLYADDGVYNVTLNVTDTSGIRGTMWRHLTILNVRPTASFAAPPGELLTSQAIPFHAEVADVDGVVASILWTFGDGTTSTAMNPTHRYASDPTTDSRDFVVTLVVTDDDGAESVAFSRTITVLQDTDSDGIPDIRDSDADGDGYTNSEETAAGSDPRDARATPADFDGDGIPNLLDRALGNLLGRSAAERDPCSPTPCKG